MLRNRNIAFFIDVDNVDLTSENFENIIAQLEGMGAVLFGKVYGAKERKHKAIYDQAEVKGYKVERPMRMKRRGRRDFDSRIFVDVVDSVCHAPSIDAVCIVTASCDLVYLYSYLHGKGIKVISSDENEEASNALVDEYVDLGRVYEIELPVVTKPVAKKASKPVVTRPAVATATRSVARAASRTAAPKVKEDAQKADNTDELLKEIERLRRVAEEQKAEKEAKSKAAEEARAKAEAEARAREEEREKAKKAIEEAKAKAREEAREEAAAKAREEARLKEQKAMEEARLKAIEEAQAKAREEERLKAQKEIEEAKRKAQEAAEKARAEEAARAKAEEEIRLKLAELAKTGGNNDELIRELEKLKHLASETNQLVKEMKDEPKEKEIVVVRDTDKEERLAKSREAEQLSAQKAIDEANAKARAEAKAREEAEAKARAHKEAGEEAAARAREEERLRAQKEIEEAKAKARAEAEAKAREEERLKAQKEIEHWRSIAEAAEAQNDEQQNDGPSARYYIPRTDGKLIRKIEELNNGSSDDDSELLATIQNLLDGLDD